MYRCLNLNLNALYCCCLVEQCCLNLNALYCCYLVEQCCLNLNALYCCLVEQYCLNLNALYCCYLVEQCCLNLNSLYCCLVEQCCYLSSVLQPRHDHRYYHYLLTRPKGEALRQGDDYSLTRHLVHLSCYS